MKLLTHKLLRYLRYRIEPHIPTGVLECGYSTATTQIPFCAKVHKNKLILESTSHHPVYILLSLHSSFLVYGGNLGFAIQNRDGVVTDNVKSGHLLRA